MTAISVEDRAAIRARAEAAAGPMPMNPDVVLALLDALPDAEEER